MNQSCLSLRYRGTRSAHDVHRSLGPSLACLTLTSDKHLLRKERSIYLKKLKMVLLIIGKPAFFFLGTPRAHTLLNAL